MAAEQATVGDLNILRESCAVVEEDILAKQNHAQSDVIFHVCIAKCTRNLVLPKLISIITYASKLFSTLTDIPLITEILTEHREILDAICNRDGEQAAKAMAQHIEHSKAMLIKIGTDSLCK